MHRPIISIVMANYNYGRFLEDAIQSVIAQDMGDRIELIICDAASSDNSVEVIRKYANGLPPNVHYSEWQANQTIQTRSPQLITWWCSEEDKGQSDAFNKGFSHAQGRFGCWLNADDVMMPGSLKEVIKYIEKYPDCEWLSGSTVFADEKLCAWRCSRCVRFWPFLGRFAPPAPVNGPSSFFLIKNLIDVGGFDINAHYVMDVDLWRRFMQKRIRLHMLQRYIWCFRLHEASKTASTITEHKVKGRTTDEADRINARYGATKAIRKVSDWINHLQRFVSCAYLWSYIDTKKYRGKNIMEIVQ